MSHHSDRRPRHILTLALVAAAILLTLIGVGIYGLLRGPVTPPQQTSTSATGSPEGARFAPGPLDPVQQAEQFARDAAEQLFAWDTSGSHAPGDYLQPLIDVADPDEAPGLANDVRGYLPTDEAWLLLKEASTRQWIEIDTLTVPESWTSVRDGELIPPGAIAYTVTGTRHRTGIWQNRTVEDARPVAFTIFLACPDNKPCRLLRLSAVDQPLR